MDEKHKLLKTGMLVVDVGAAPGGWSQVIADRTSSKKGAETCVAVDLLEMMPIQGVHFVQGDIEDHKI